MATNIKDMEHRFWRTDPHKGRNIYALLSNDPNASSSSDPLIGVMESTTLTEIVVNSHNDLLEKYGRHYPEYLAKEKRDGDG